MSATDRAFIHAYGDETGDAPEKVQPPVVRARTLRTVATHNAEINTGASTPTTPPRRSARRAVRSAAAAALSSTPAPSGPASTATNPVAPAMPVATAAATKAKLIVGRRALARLAESAVALAPQTNISGTAPHSDKRLESSAHREGAHESQSNSPVTLHQPLNKSPRDSIPTDTAAKPMTPQYRVDAPAASAPDRSRLFATHSPVAPMVTPVGGATAKSHGTRPLASHLTTVSPPAPLAALEVDRFSWPATCDALLESAREPLESLAALLRSQLDSGVQVVALAGAIHGCGCTTVVMSLGRILSAAGLMVCLMDADFREPRLAECLGLDPDRGLESVLSGEAAVTDVLVESLDDNMTLLPLAKPVAAALVDRSRLRQTVTLGELRDHYDLVLIDAGHPHATGTHPTSILKAGSGIDAAILVIDAQRSPAELQQTGRALEQCDVQCLGVIENRLTP